MLSLSEDTQSKVFNFTSRYLDDLLNIDNSFDSMVYHIYPSELQLNKATVSGTGASFLDLLLSKSEGLVNTKIYDNKFPFLNFLFLDGYVPRSTSYGVYNSQLIHLSVQSC